MSQFALLPEVSRLFVALPVPEDVKEEIERVQGELRSVLPRGVARLTRRAQFHVTLRFLGAVEQDRMKALVDAMRVACAETAPIELRAERVGVFPDLRFPRVAWVWVHDDAGQLPALQKKIDAAVGAFAAARAESAFTGHVTIARIDGIKRPQAETLATWVHEMTGRRFGDWAAAEAVLMRSEVTAAGAVHSVVAAAPLIR